MMSLSIFLLDMLIGLGLDIRLTGLRDFAVSCPIFVWGIHDVVHEQFT